MSVYLLINILIILIPLLLSIEKNLRFYKNLKYYINSVLVVSSVYIAWDVLATWRGDWAFNPAYVTGVTLFRLPIEEILFFITVPYSCIFIYETVSFYLREKDLKIKRSFFAAPVILLLIMAIIFNDQSYTFTVFIFTAVFFPSALYLYPAILQSRAYWITMLITFIPFLAVNYFLTSLPVVTYNENEIFGLRIITIPAEDFFYSFSMISYWLLFYNYFKHRR